MGKHYTEAFIFSVKIKSQESMNKGETYLSPSGNSPSRSPLWRLTLGSVRLHVQ